MQKNFGSTASLNVVGDPVGVGRGAALGADLSGRRRIRRHPPGQGDARAAPARSRHRARPGAVDGDPGLGPARGRQGADPRDPGAGRRPPRSRSTACARKPASASAPRSTCSMRSRIWSMRGWRWSPRSATAWWRPTRCWRRSAPVAADPRAWDPGLRPDGALSAGPRRLGRRAHARRAVAHFHPNGNRIVDRTIRIECAPRALASLRRFARPALFDCMKATLVDGTARRSSTSTTVCLRSIFGIGILLRLHG